MLAPKEIKDFSVFQTEVGDVFQIIAASIQLPTPKGVGLSIRSPLGLAQSALLIQSQAE